MTQIQNQQTVSKSDTSVPPVKKSVRVRISPEAAFERFTKYINDWWPLPDYSVGQENSSHVVFGSRRGEQIVEHMKDGSTSVWGTILEWERGRRVVFSWHPDRGPEVETQVAVTFRVDGDATEVELVHTGWEVLGDEAVETRDSYDGGWNVVIEKYAQP